MIEARRWMAPAVAALLALGIAGCDGGGDDGGDGNEEPSAAATQATPNGATPSTTGEPSGAGDGDAADAYRDAVTAFIESTFRAEYRVTSSPDDELQNATMVIFKQGENRIRTDITADQEGERVELVVIDVRDDPEGSGFCLAEAGELGELFGIDANEGVCFASDPTQGAGGFGFLTDGLDDLENENVEVTGQSERRIAGRDADCFDVIDDNGQQNEVCIGGDGELLYVSGEDGSVFEATAVDDDVEDGDFDLPYEVRDLSAPPPGAGAGQ